MQSNKSRDTKPELAVRRAVHAHGLRYRVSARPLPELRRTADMVFRGAKVAVFIDGCFWHGCLQHHSSPATNADYWMEKVRRNQERDRDTDARLAEAGWTIVRSWEHEDPAEVAMRVVEIVRSLRSDTTKLTEDGLSIGVQSTTTDSVAMSDSSERREAGGAQT